MHKSNATYFSDLDISRTHLLTALCGNGIDHVRKEMAVKKDDRFSIMLGGVSCTFRREIKPYQPFEIWSRVLCWDRKWLYIVSHFVKKGDVKPMGYTLRPRKTTAAVGGKTATQQESNGKPNMHINIVAATHPAIFASGISKYVFKKGRLTIPPERILDASNLLPAKPAGHHTPPMTPSPLTSEGSSLFFGTASVLQDLDPRNVNEVIDASLLPGDDDEEVWNWTMAENERLRGMKIAELMAGLDSLHEEFTAEKTPALGEY